MTWTIEEEKRAKSVFDAELSKPETWIVSLGRIEHRFNTYWEAIGFFNKEDGNRPSFPRLEIK